MMSTHSLPQDPAGTVANSVLISLRKISQSIAINSRSLVKRVGLTGPQLTIIQEVFSSGEVSIGEVAKAISLSQGTVTGIIERLEKRGLVIRRRSDSDRRRVLVQTTAAGRQLLETAPPLMQELFVERFNNLQEWEQTMILSSLQRLITIMDVKSIESDPILTAATIDESATNVKLEK
jgi:DNA-binding MarR family transcriptional regulator